MSTEAAITVEGVSKTFRLPHQRYSTLKERALHPFRSRAIDELHALQDVSVSVSSGEFFGIVGRNGSGKSTLLKCLAGIYEADRGTMQVDGKLSPFIELGVGFNPDLTARDNVLINAILLGLSRREARERFDDIIAFAELEEFLDLKLKNYSSGMYVRLAFAVATQVDADVLLIDEVLAVGDAAFQQKCFDQFLKLKDAGRTIVFVTHDMHAVERFCDRAMLLERGRIVDIGDPHEIAQAYNEINFGRFVHDAPEGARYGDRAEAEITAAWFEDAAGERIRALAPGRAAAGRRWRSASALRSTSRCSASRCATTPARRCSRPGPTCSEVPTGRFEAGDVAIVRVTLDNWLAPGAYRLTPSLARAGAGTEALDARENLTVLTVHGTAQRRRAGRPAARDRDRAAMSDDARRFWELTWMLAVTDWKLRFYGSALGYAWTLARPFAFFGVIYVVFTEIADVGTGDQGLRRLHPLLAGAVPVLRRGDNGLRDVGRPAREPAAQDALPAPRDPAEHGHDGAAEPRRDARRRVRVRDRRRRLPDLELARAAAADRRARRGGDRDRDAARRAVRALPRRAADLGRGHADPVLRVADPLRRDDGAGGLPAGVPVQPARGDPHAGAPRGRRPGGADRCRR